MLIAKSNQYFTPVYDESISRWKLDRIHDDGTKETLLINRAKYVDVKNNIVYHLSDNGQMSSNK